MSLLDIVWKFVLSGSYHEGRFNYESEVFLSLCLQLRADEGFIKGRNVRI